MKIERRYVVLSDSGIILGIHKTKKQAMCQMDGKPGSADSNVNNLVEPKYVVCWPSKYESVIKILRDNKK